MRPSSTDGRRSGTRSDSNGSGSTRIATAGGSGLRVFRSWGDARGTSPLRTSRPLRTTSRGRKVNCRFGNSVLLLVGVPHGPEEGEVRTGTGGNQAREPDRTAERTELAGGGVPRRAGPAPRPEEGPRRPGPGPPGRTGPSCGRDAGPSGPTERVPAEGARPHRAEAEGPGPAPRVHRRGA